MVFIIILLGMLQSYSLLDNLGYYVYGLMPTISGLVTSSLCLLFWAGIGLYCGYKNDKRYVIVASVFWLGELVFYLIGFFLINNNVTGFITGSLYGLRYIIPLSKGFWLTIALNAIAYTVSNLSFCIGHFIGKNKNESKIEQ